MDKLLRVTELMCQDTGNCLERQFLYEVNAGTEQAPILCQFIISVMTTSTEDNPGAALIADAKVIADERASVAKANLVAAYAHPPTERYDVAGEVTL